MSGLIGAEGVTERLIEGLPGSAGILPAGSRRSQDLPPAARAASAPKRNERSVTPSAHRGQDGQDGPGGGWQGLGLVAGSLVALLPGGIGFAQTVSSLPAAHYAVGTNPASVAIGDLDGDGVPDLAVANANFGATVSILLGTGAGTFGGATNYAVGPFPYSIAKGDLSARRRPASRGRFSLRPRPSRT